MAILQAMSVLTNFKQRLAADINTIPAVLNTKELPSLNGLRAFSIIIVIYRHAIWLQLQQDSFLNGDFGVTIFFVISGFLITSLLLKEKVIKEAISLKRFFIRRVLRILPLAYLYLIVLLILDAFGLISVSTGEYLSGFLYFNNWYPVSTYVSHYWSLSVEEQFYLFFPFFLKKLKLRYYVYICILFMLMAPVITYFANHSFFYQNAFRQLLPLVKFQSIAIGSLMAIIIYKNLFSFEKLTSVFIKLAVLALMILAYKVDSPADINKVVCSAFIAIFIVINLYPKKDIIYMLLNNRLVNYIGLMSYSLYIWQQLFTFEHMPWRNAFPYAGSIAFNIPVLFIVAYFSYNYFEKPFLKLKKNYS